MLIATILNESLTIAYCHNALLNITMGSVLDQFVSKNSSSIDFNIEYGNNKIGNVYNTKFLGLTLENTLSWRTHIDTIVPKLSSASFALRVVKPFLSQDSLEMVYYSYFHSIMTWINILGEFPL
jgi:hypothetical protein